ncbi:MAG: PKD domain-containing protein [Saprospiraceae bacterium]
MPQLIPMVFPWWKSLQALQKENPVVVYDNPGTYDVSLTATNTVGDNTYSQSSFITVGSAPSASFDFNLTDASASFNNNSTGGTSYTWDFGDGTTASNMQDLPGVHVFPGNGDYTVTLTVENACGTETFSQVISINGSVPAAGFDTDVRRFCAPGTVNFTDASTGNPTVWKWTFPGGNPATSTDQNPSVTYDTPGTYGVSLEVTNSFECNQVMQTAFICQKLHQ